jgi:general stress protein YciG
MDPAKQREIASKGGKAAHQKGTAHEFTPDEAREAGRKGGQAAHGRGTAHKFTSEEAREAGRKGGRSVRASAAARTSESIPNGAAAPSMESPAPTETGPDMTTAETNDEQRNQALAPPMTAWPSA